MTEEKREDSMTAAGQTQAEALKELLRDFHGNGSFPSKRPTDTLARDHNPALPWRRRMRQLPRDPPEALK